MSYYHDDDDRHIYRITLIRWQRRESSKVTTPSSFIVDVVVVCAFHHDGLPNPLQDYDDDYDYHYYGRRRRHRGGGHDLRRRERPGLSGAAARVQGAWPVGDRDHRCPRGFAARSPRPGREGRRGDLGGIYRGPSIRSRAWMRFRFRRSPIIGHVILENVWPR